MILVFLSTLLIKETLNQLGARCFGALFKSQGTKRARFLGAFGIYGKDRIFS